MIPAGEERGIGRPYLNPAQDAKRLTHWAPQCLLTRTPIQVEIQWDGGEPQARYRDPMSLVGPRCARPRPSIERDEALHSKALPGSGCHCAACEPWKLPMNLRRVAATFRLRRRFRGISLHGGNASLPSRRIAMSARRHVMSAGRHVTPPRRHVMSPGRHVMSARRQGEPSRRNVTPPRRHARKPRGAPVFGVSEMKACPPPAGLHSM